MKASDRRPRRNRRELSDERRRKLEDNGNSTPSDFDLTTDRLAFFREAGASEILLTLIDTIPEDAGVTRNSARQKAQEHIFYGDHNGEPENFSHDGGGFFTKMWDGDLYEAYRQADLSNATLLEAVFGEDCINSARLNPADPKISELDFNRFLICNLPLRPEFPSSESE